MERRLIVNSFTAYRIEQQRPCRTAFPSGIEIRLLDSPQAWEHGEPGILYVTFCPEPAGESAEYKISEADLRRCTKIVVPARE
jgi:hypothetical protein